ncbi:hypothetical protein [Pseudomonas sp. GM80]|uniref:hypothetical protein n=1 Tax=Pseudomonas sp. GM80 TaxID=1144339 RepID=UPI00026F695E|nr:hypothetical protein [Pseudomonas sp. GM80]EJN25109.1 hypothetical protein PMI37_04326 [Pseudomonas sp. GM80]
MLDRTKKDRACVGFCEFEWLGLTSIERRLIGLYRLLSEQEQLQLRRLSEVLATKPEDGANN